MIVLALNAGSSSVKFALFDAGGGAERELARGAIAGVGQPDAQLVVRSELQTEAATSQVTCRDIPEAARLVFAALEEALLPRPQAVGHRLVHGGPHHAMPSRIDAELRRDLEGAVRFSPLHLPRALELVDAASAHYGNPLQIACFDTTFHRRLPELARRLPLPEELHGAGIHRYGFHGISYESIVQNIGPERLGRAVLAHLGSGSSLAAVRDGRPIDTTMGLTPAGGIPMGTRSGDLDPGVLVHLMDHFGYDARKLDDLVNHRSGLLGVSGTTGDMKSLLARRRQDPRAHLAVDMYCYAVRKSIGAYAAALGGIDTLVFTGGIGERAAAVRTGICDGLGHLGIRLDEARNEVHHESISARESRCHVRVVRTDEEQVIAQHTVRAAEHHGDAQSVRMRAEDARTSDSHCMDTAFGCPGTSRA